MTTKGEGEVPLRGPSGPMGAAAPTDYGIGTRSQCARCGGVIAPQAARGPRRKFCQTCRPSWRVNPMLGPFPVSCFLCGDPIVGRRRDARYCSDRCCAAAAQGHVVAYCALCGDRCGHTHPETDQRRYCSKDCAATYTAAAGKALTAAKQRHPFRGLCRECGTPLAGIPSRIDSIYCSEACLRVVAARNTTSPGRPAHLRIRKRHRDAVLERYGYVCGICGDDIDPDLAYPSPFAATVDHIIPLKRGGVHHPDNWQPAHHYCNNVKRDSLPEEDF